MANDSRERRSGALVILCEFLDHWITRLIGMMLGFVVLVMLLAVWTRYVMNDPVAWTEQLSRILFVWMTFLGAAVLYRRSQHIAIDFFTNLMPDRLARIIRFVNEAAMLVLFLVLLVYGAGLVRSTLSQTYGALDVSPAVFYAAAPVSAGLMLLFWLEHLLQELRSKGACDSSHQTGSAL